MFILQIKISMQQYQVFKNTIVFPKIGTKQKLLKSVVHKLKITIILDIFKLKNDIHRPLHREINVIIRLVERYIICIKKCH